ncbi:asparagine synthase-related protein [Vibrio cincinnatiensis]|uniref:asparagine synthase-related protein n=1 Tax=Vibrio cincinnatiensis TaxID=675 RepID=UPI001EE14729|nr:asparagine synthase-related protein [Vibrio cincinnatiensis]MCG3733171.1 hypothetical protein [Vibrio cincinnatiensis]
MKNRFVRIEIEFDNRCSPLVNLESEGMVVSEYGDLIHITTQGEMFADTALYEKTYYEIAKKSKGLIVIKNESGIKILNDSFCSIPLYYFKKSGKVFITTEPYDYPLASTNHIDEAGLWECILFGSSLWNRTLFKGLYQFPSASELAVCNEDHLLSRYWDFNYSEDNSLNNENTLIEALDDKLTNIFSRLPETQYLMGISGGLDSRLSAAYLDKANKAHLVNTFTYCSTKHSLDYQLSQQVCAQFGLAAPSLHILNENAYRSTLDFLPKYTCGQIGIQHAHICSVLSNHKEIGSYTQLSNYFSDALFGYECSGGKSDNISEDTLRRTLNAATHLSPFIRDEIMEDINKIYSEFNPEANYSSLDEYKYVTERNQKFHMNLAFQQSRFVDTVLPYATYELLEFMMSVPLHFRNRKHILDLLFTSGVVKKPNMQDISSKHFISGNEFSSQGLNPLIKKIDFKLQNVLSALTAKLTLGRAIFPNKYHTESHVNMLHRFSDELEASCSRLKDMGVFSSEQYYLFNQVPIKSAGVSERFQLISIDHLIQMGRNVQ